MCVYIYEKNNYMVTRLSYNLYFSLSKVNLPHWKVKPVLLYHELAILNGHTGNYYYRVVNEPERV